MGNFSQSIDITIQKQSGVYSLKSAEYFSYIEMKRAYRYIDSDIVPVLVIVVVILSVVAVALSHVLLVLVVVRLSSGRTDHQTQECQGWHRETGHFLVVGNGIGYVEDILENCLQMF